LLDRNFQVSGSIYLVSISITFISLVSSSFTYNFGSGGEGGGGSSVGHVFGGLGGGGVLTVGSSSSIQSQTSSLNLFVAHTKSYIVK